MRILLFEACVNYAVFLISRREFNENMIKAMKTFLIISPFFAWSVLNFFFFLLLLSVSLLERCVD